MGKEFLELSRGYDSAGIQSRAIFINFSLMIDKPMGFILLFRCEAVISWEKAMLEERESSSFSGGCFINLCDVGGNATPPKRKNALPDMGAQQELANAVSEDSCCTRRRIDCEVKAKQDRDTENIGSQNRLIEGREKQRRKQGVVVGVDPNVDAYLTRLKKLDTSTGTGFAEQGGVNADVDNNKH